VRDDELDVSWAIFTPLLHAIDAGKIKNEPYEYGSRGPAALNDFIARYGYQRTNESYEWPTTNVKKVQGKM
jgi:glucose-6-phosphate 1-dehydrogenase